MTTKLVKKFFWKELTKDGLLKEPTYPLNGEHDSEEDAVTVYSKFVSSDSWCPYHELVLITVYQKEFS